MHRASVTALCEGGAFPKRAASSKSGEKSEGSEISAKTYLDAAWGNVLMKCRDALREGGASFPRFGKLYGEDGLDIPSKAMVEVQDNVFRAGSSSPETIVGYLKENQGFLKEKPRIS